MGHGARTPEELETLFEDAFLLRDTAALCSLFEGGGTLVADGLAEVHCADLERVVTVLLARDVGYVAQVRRIVQARDTALVLSDDAVNVVRRDNGLWHYAIAVLSTEHALPSEEVVR
jgi:hypothetical protein